MLDITKLKQVARGFYSDYFLLEDNIGAKVLRPVFTSSDNIPKSTWANANLEFSFLNKAYPSGITPKPIDLCAIKQKHHYRIALLMQHLPYPTLKDYELANPTFKEKYREVVTWVRDKLEEYQIYHNDLHNENILIKDEETYYAIDFTPDYTEHF